MPVRGHANRLHQTIDHGRYPDGIVAQCRAKVFKIVPILYIVPNHLTIPIASG